MKKATYIKISILALTALISVIKTGDVYGQQVVNSAECLRRAESMYANIWQHYRVWAYTGLFSERFPSSKKDSVTYFRGDAQADREVSFLWPFSGMFSATNVLLKVPGQRNKYLPYLDSIAIGMESYRDTLRKPVGYQAYPSRFSKDDRYYDDNGLVGIEYAEAYLNTKNPIYLSRAKTAFKFILSGWDDKLLGGGVFWVEGNQRDYKPACSNGMAMLVALKLYQGTHDKAYLDWGTRFYDWMYKNLKNPDGIYYNDRKTASDSVNETYYSYNSGSMVQAGVLLYQFTKEKKYLNEAKITAEASYQHFSKGNQNPNLIHGVDLPWFLTVLFKGYEGLYKIDGNDKYVRAVKHDLDYAWSNTRDKYGFVTDNWTNDPKQLADRKWLLDEACVAELYARLSMLKIAKLN